MLADSGASYPSGHATVVAALAAALIVAGLAALPALQPYLRRIDARARHR